MLPRASRAGDATPLYLAAQRGFTNVTAVLLEAGADPNHVMPRGAYSMQVTVAGGGSVEPLAAGGFYPERNGERGNGATALHAAVENGHALTAELLLSRGARQLPSMEGVAPLLLALQYHHPHIAIALANALPTPSPGQSHPVDATSPQDGASALFVAAGEGYLPVVHHLLQLGATVDLPNAHGATPLSHAVHRAHLAVASVLLEAGADPRRGPSGGGGVLHAALRAGSVRGSRLATLTEALLGAGGGASAVDEGGTTALALAADSGEVDTCRTLLAHGANASAASALPSGITPLMRASAKGHVRVASLLIEEGRVDVDMRAGPRHHGATALYLAAQGKHHKVLQRLLVAGAAVDAAIEQVGTTALFAAAEQGCVRSVETLVAHGADVSLPNWNGIGATHMAAMRGHVAVVRALTVGREGAAGGGSASRGGASVPSSMPPRMPSRVPVDVRSADGSTPLICVASGLEPLTPRRQVPMIRWLLEAGADVEAATLDGTTALAAAASNGQAEALKLLLTEGHASPDATTPDDAAPGGAAPGDAAASGVSGRRTSAIEAATRRRDVASVAALVSAGATARPQALELAVAMREHELITLLS